MTISVSRESFVDQCWIDDKHVVLGMITLGMYDRMERQLFDRMTWAWSNTHGGGTDRIPASWAERWIATDFVNNMTQRVPGWNPLPNDWTWERERAGAYNHIAHLM